MALLLSIFTLSIILIFSILLIKIIFYDKNNKFSSKYKFIIKFLFIIILFSFIGLCLLDIYNTVNINKTNKPNKTIQDSITYKVNPEDSVVITIKTFKK